MNDENKQNVEAKETEPNQKAELLDSSLIKVLIIAACVYFVSYSIFSLIFGNAFGAFIATPLTTISFFITSRWDRLRESKEISFENTLDAIKSLKVSIKVVLFSLIFILIIQLAYGLLSALFLYFYNPEFSADNVTDFIEKISDDIILALVIAFGGFYLTGFLGGYFAASLALYKNLLPYRHTILSIFLWYVLDLSFKTLIYFIDSGEVPQPFGEEDANVGLVVFIFSQLFLVPLIGARVAVWKYKNELNEVIKKEEADKKEKEEFEALVGSEIERLKPKTNNKQKNKATPAKTKKKT